MTSSIRISTFCVFITSCMLLSCAEESSDQNEVSAFTRIYDNNLFSYSFTPVDVLQTSDGGYVVLAAKFTPDEMTGGIYLLKADKLGNFVKDLPLAETFVNALPGMTISNGKITFMCMASDAQGTLVSVDEHLEEVTVTSINVTYPSAVTFIDNEFLVLGYDQIERKSVFSRVSPSGNVLSSRLFTIADDESLEDEIMRHFLRTGKQFPFQVGRISSGKYFFNGFYDYTFSLVFTSLGGDDDVDGVVQGQQENSGFSSVIPLPNNFFAVSYFSIDHNYIAPHAQLALNEITSITTVEGLHMREFAGDAKVQIFRATLDGANVLVYGSSTQSKQIGLFMYDEATGQFMGARYFGFSNPFEFGRLASTSDGGVVIAGATYIAGRFSRLCLIKMSKEDFTSINRQ